LTRELLCSVCTVEGYELVYIARKRKNYPEGRGNVPTYFTRIDADDGLHHILTPLPLCYALLNF